MSQSVVPSSSLRCWMTCLILCIVSLHPCNLWKTNQYSKMRSDYEHNLCWNHLIIFFVTCWYCSISSKLGNKTKFLIINQLDAPISQIYLGMNLYVFQTVPLSIIRSFFHCTHSIGICHTGLLTACEQDQAGTAVPSWSCSLAVSKTVWHIPLLCLQLKLLMMGRGTVWNM